MATNEPNMNNLQPPPLSNDTVIEISSEDNQDKSNDVLSKQNEPIIVLEVKIKIIIYFIVL